MKYIYLAFFAQFILSACAHKTVEIDTFDDIRISLIADTQNTTDKLKKDYGFRSRLADQFENVSIRPAAVEKLALENMENMGRELNNDSPDIVLYLGDGANSGCKDEVDDFFKSLALIRGYLNIPVFFVIGNHDYLGTGNQDRQDIRSQLCGGHEFYSKGQLIALTSKFNAESFQDFNKNNFLTSFIDNVNQTHTSCLAERGQSEHLMGCFYSAYITFKKNVYGDLLLLDTSDYRDIDARPAIGDALEGYGIRGAISFNERNGTSQVGWFERQIEKNNHKPEFRIMASHYPSNDLKWDIGPIDKAGRTGSLMLKNNQNLWLSGHTHTDRPESSLFLDGFYSGTGLVGKRRYAEANVGSTTDYPPHTSTIFHINGKLRKKDRFLPVFANKKECDQIYSNIKNYTSDAPAYGVSKGYAALGMSTEYKNSNWGWNEMENAKTNLMNYLKKYGDKSISNKDRTLAVSCILNKSSFLEYSEK